MNGTFLLSSRDMSLGSVNDLGQFISRFEQDADIERKKGNFFASKEEFHQSTKFCCQVSGIYFKKLTFKKLTVVTSAQKNKTSTGAYLYYVNFKILPIYFKFVGQI